MLLRNALARRSTPLSAINNPNVPLYSALMDFMDGAPSDAGISVTPSSALRLAVVYRCVQLISDTIAAMPLRVYRRDDDSREVLRMPADSIVWDQPNGNQTPVEFWAQAILSTLLYGNAYINTVRQQNGAIGELWVLDPSVFTPSMTAGGTLVFEQQRGPTLTQGEVVHIPGMLQPGRITGLSPIANARQAVGLGLAAEKFGARFFGAGAMPATIITSKGKFTDEEQPRRIKQRFKDTFSGANQSWGVAVLDADASVTTLSMPLEDAQFMELRKFQSLDICGLYGVPPHLAGIVDVTSSWGTGIEQQNIQFVNFTLRPWAIRFEQAISRWLLPVKERYARWAFDALERGDMQARVGYYAAGRRDGWLNPNEIRRLEELAPREGGDVYQDTPTGASPNEPVTDEPAAPASAD